MTAGGLADRRFLALIAVSFLISLCNAPRYALLPVYVEADLLRTPLFSAGLRSLFLILGGGFALVAGPLADRYGVKRVYVLGTVGPVLTGAVFLLRDPLLLSALCIGMGVSQGFDSAGGQSYLINAVRADVIGTASAGYFLGSTVGTAVGNAISGPVADAFGYQLLGAVGMGAGVLLTVVAVILLPAIPTQRASTGSQAVPVSSTAALLRRPGVPLLLGLRYLPTCYWGAVTLLLPIFIYRLTGSNSDVTTFSAVSLTAAAACQILTGRMIDRFGRWRPVLVAAAIETLSGAGLALFAGSLVGIYVFGIIAAASAWALSTTIPGLLQSTVAPAERGRLVGAAHFSWSAGMLTGNLGGGALLAVSAPAPFLIGSVFCGGAFLCAVGLWRARDRSPGALAAGSAG